MAFEILSLAADDIPACISIYFGAFQNPHSLGCWPRTANVRAWWEKMFRDELEEAGSHWLKAVAKSTGELAGFAKWVRHPDGMELSTDLPEWPEDADEGLCDETFGTWAREHRSLMGLRGHWYLEIVATSPAFQGRGVGSQMLCWGTSRADDEGVEAYLEASPNAVRLYERFGWREKGRTDTWIENERVAGTWYPNLFMVRAPRQWDTGRSSSG